MPRMLAILASLLLVGVSNAAPPSIRAIDRAGLQIGGATVLTIDGDNLLPDPKIVLSVPIASQKLLEKPTEKRIQLEITLDKKVEPGLYNLRLANADGVSSGRVIAVDHLPQQNWLPDLTTLPVSLHGNLSGSNRLRTSFPGKKGQTLLFEVEAQRLGGKVSPVLHLHDAAGKQLAWSRPMPLLGGDTRLQATLPADGAYTVELHDLEYAAGAPGTVRLKIGNWQYADAVFPQAVQRGQSASVELVGAPAGKRIQVKGAGDGAALPVAWEEAANASGMRPWILLSELPEFVEKEDQPIQNVPAWPVGLNGRVAKEGQVDRFKLKVQPGSKVRFDLFADRIGSPMDAVLRLEREDGKQLVQADDRPGSPDPLLDYTVPKDVTTLVVAVEDLHGRGKPTFLYRVVVTPTDGLGLQDFRVEVPTSEFNVPAGGSRAIEVAIDRRGYDGPLQLAFPKLPPGVKLEGGTVPAGATGALLILTGNGTPATITTNLRAESKDPKLKTARLAREQNHPLQKLQPWLAEELVVSLAAADKLAFQANIGSLPETKLIPGKPFKVPVSFNLPKSEIGAARIYLLTSQAPVLANNKRPDPNRNLRVDKGAFLELPANKNAGDFNVFVPATLPTLPHEIAFRVDLLSKDKKTVLAQAFTPVRRLEVENPLAVQAAAAQIDVPLDGKTGGEIKLTGKLVRRGGFKGDVVISVDGLPPGLPVPKVTVKGNQTDYQAVIKVPANFATREFAVDVFATGKIDPKSPLPNRSDNAPVKVKLTLKK